MLFLKIPLCMGDLSPTCKIFMERLANLSLMEFQVRCLALSFLFSVTDDSGWFWMRSLHKNT